MEWCHRAGHVAAAMAMFAWSTAVILLVLPRV